jgi:hypothetical protein
MSRGGGNRPRAVGRRLNPIGRPNARGLIPTAPLLSPAVTKPRFKQFLCNADAARARGRLRWLPRLWPHRLTRFLSNADAARAGGWLLRFAVFVAGGPARPGPRSARAPAPPLAPRQACGHPTPPHPYPRPRPRRRIFRPTGDMRLAVGRVGDQGKLTSLAGDSMPWTSVKRDASGGCGATAVPPSWPAQKINTETFPKTDYLPAITRKSFRARKSFHPNRPRAGRRVTAKRAYGTVPAVPAGVGSRALHRILPVGPLRVVGWTLRNVS